jgi:NAD(P)H-hydrate repair Nnr-like enzyme with NAD(P)H-hydrate dehydratase domain
MRLAMTTLMLSFVALNPSSCTPQEIDSFCQVYNQVVLQKGDGTIVASPGVKRRLLANELTYKQLCQAKA